MGFEGERQVCCFIERSAIFVVGESLQECIVAMFFSAAPITI